MRARSLFGMLLVGSAAACASTDTEQVIPPVVLGMVETTAPTYDDGQMQIYEVYVPVPLPLRAPRDGEGGGAAVAPYPRAPFHLANQTRITARFTLSNLENTQHTVELLVNPWNEFVRYQPGAIITEEATTPNFSGIDKFFIVPPLGRVEGILTPDDMVELATDLGTAMRLAETPPAEDSQFAGPALFNRAFNIQNRSSQNDPVLGPFIPAVVAGLTGFDLGLRTYEKAKLAVEVVLDVEDVDGDRVIQAGDTIPRIGQPGAILAPPAAPMR